MASGDTKTEALLNILGNGGSVDGITGSGNTKTQDYLVDAIERLQRIEDEISSGGCVTFYAKDGDVEDGKTVHLYKDAEFTMAATVQEVWDAVYSGKDIKIISKSTTETDYSFRIIWNMVQAYYPATCTVHSMDQTGFQLYFSYAGSKNTIELTTFRGPTYTEFDCLIY